MMLAAPVALAPVVAIAVPAGAGAECPEARELYYKGLYPEYVAELKRQAESGDAACQFQVAVAYKDGVIVQKDFKEALTWYRYAAERGHAFAQFDLGTMYDYGDGVPIDRDEAARWYRRSADQGFMMARYNLAVMYDKGVGVGEDKDRARLLLDLMFAGPGKTF